jgi:Ca2+-binding RTX toxin-like protein
VRIGIAVALAGSALLATAALAGFIGGTDGPDTLRGTSGPDRIAGRGGGDLITGRSGRDQLSGGRGGDLLKGGADKDKLEGGRGSDRLLGGEAVDKYYCGPGRDEFNTRDGVVLGSPGNDVIRARDGVADEIDCGAGFDKVFVDEVEDGVYNCEKVAGPKGEIGKHVPPDPEEEE